MSEHPIPVQPDIAVIGAGDAGIAAAKAAAATGATTIVIADDVSRTGSRPPSVVLIEASVWACLVELTLAMTATARSFTIRPRTVVVATGGAAQPANTAALAQMAGARVQFLPSEGSWLPLLDENRMTTVSGLYVAGSAAGLCSSEVATREGRLAGLAAVAYTGAVAVSEIDAARAALQATDPGRLRQSAARPQAVTLDQESTIVCACEGVTRHTVTFAISRGASSVNDVKRRTRAGMGECQGRNCTSAIANLLHHVAGISFDAIDPMTARPPLRPITLAQLAELNLA